MTGLRPSAIGLRSSKAISCYWKSKTSYRSWIVDPKSAFSFRCGKWLSVIGYWDLRFICNLVLVIYNLPSYTTFSFMFNQTWRFSARRLGWHLLPVSDRMWSAKCEKRSPTPPRVPPLKIILQSSRFMLWSFGLNQRTVLTAAGFIRHTSQIGSSVSLSLNQIASSLKLTL